MAALMAASLERGGGGIMPPPLVSFDVVGRYVGQGVPSPSTEAIPASTEMSMMRRSRIPNHPFWVFFSGRSGRPGC